MTIIVCVKQVPAVGEVQIDPQKNTLVREGVPTEINPSDLNALEAALELKEKHGARLLVLSMGPRQAEEALRDCLARGADDAFLLCDPAFAGSDTLATARVLAAAIRKAGRDCALILCGHESVDGNTAQVGPEVGEILGVPHVNNVFRVQLIEQSVLVERKVGDVEEGLEIELPCLLSVQRGINSPRPAEGPAKPVRILGARDLGVPAQDSGLAGSATRVQRIFPPRPIRGMHPRIDSRLSARKRIELILAGGMEARKDQVVLAEAAIDYDVILRDLGPFLPESD